MTLSNKSFEQMLEEIEFKECILYDILIPEENPKFFKPADSLLPFKRPQKIVYKILGDILGIEHFFTMPIEEAVLNAFERGNKCQDYLPVSVKVFKGDKGCVLRIRDSGEGFDYKETLEKYDDGKVYYKRFGLGFYHFNRTFYDVAFESEGNIVNIQIFK